MTPLAVALDLGSTRIKTGVLGDAGNLVDIRSADAPPLAGTGLVRECDAREYIDTSRRLLERTLRGTAPDIPVGIASQRSSFLLWDAASGVPATPLISWQDRRAHEWCRAHARYNERLSRRTGLRLSPHYAAPKLASLLAADASLRRNVAALRFGTLETYFLWCATRGRVHETDVTMAARTLLADPVTGRWDPEWLDVFNVPEGCLPRIMPTWGRGHELEDGGLVTATVTDQAAGVIALLATTRRGLLVNLGTGGFVTVPTGKKMKRVDGYLSGPLVRAPDGSTRYTTEGTINGIGTSLSQAPRVVGELAACDPLPGVFCSPDSSGVGAPYWRADVPLVLSRSPDSMSPWDHRRVILEGIIFRIAGIVGALCPRRLPDDLLLSGGLAAEPFIARGLASCLRHPVRVTREKESTLLGAARLAAGAARTSTPPDVTPVSPAHPSYLPEKFSQWVAWMDRMLAAQS
ncbi:MAG: FGGY family carbohydrate kinase [Candidatus Krumholzibacteriia bacterium]